jgi:HAD superfamily hydrolase (TIGR01509 family)
MLAAIFDCDGTLVDSEPLAVAAWERSLARHGYALADGDLDGCVGLPFRRVHARFAALAAARGGALPDADAFWPDYAGELFALIDAGALRIFPDAVGAAAELQRRGVPVAVASSSPRERLDRTLAAAGLADAFPVTVAGDEVARGKPAPDMFLAAAARLGAAPQDCVVVEDSPPGVEAGLAAGMAVVAVCREPGAEASLAAATRVVRELTAEVILAAAAPSSASAATRRRAARG